MLEENNGFKLPVSEYYERKREEREERENLQDSPAREIVVYPKPLTIGYYEEKINQYPYKSKDWYLWIAFKNYAEAVKNFYCAVMKSFNKTLYRPIRLPEYLDKTFLPGNDLSKNIERLDYLSQELVKAERSLIDSLDMNRTSITARCNKHAALRDLRELSAIGWLVYYNMKRDNFYHSVVNFKSKNEDKDLTKDRDVSLLYMGHMKTKNFVKTKVKGFFSASARNGQFKNLQPKSSKLYEDVNPEIMFERVMLQFDGYNYQDKEEWFAENLSNVTDEKALMVINFYKHYADVKIIYKKMLHAFNEAEAHKSFANIYIDIDNPNRDIFETAQKYYLEVSALLEMAKQNEEYSFVVKDCLFIQNKLNQAIQMNKKPHEDMVKQREEAIKNFPSFINNIPKI